jgi:hypothetical protein
MSDFGGDFGGYDGGFDDYDGGQNDYSHDDAGHDGGQNDYDHGYDDAGHDQDYNDAGYDHGGLGDVEVWDADCGYGADVGIYGGTDFYGGYHYGSDFYVYGAGIYPWYYLGDPVVVVGRDGRITGNMGGHQRHSKGGRNWPSNPVNCECGACGYTGPTLLSKGELKKDVVLTVMICILLIWAILPIFVLIYALCLDDDNRQWSHHCGGCKKRLGKSV